MADKGREEWYSNKELYEMFQSLKEELKLTIEAVKRYNGIRNDLNNVMGRLLAIEQQAIGRYTVGKALREWGGWVVAILSCLATLKKMGAI